MPKLVDYTSHIKIDDKMLIKGTLEYEVFGDPREIVRVYRYTSPNIVFEGHYSTWTNFSDQSYSSVISLTSDLDKFLPSPVNTNFLERQNDSYLKVYDSVNQNTLDNIENQLRIVNIHLSAITELENLKIK